MRGILSYLVELPALTPDVDDLAVEMGPWIFGVGEWSEEGGIQDRIV